VSFANYYSDADPLGQSETLEPDDIPPPPQTVTPPLPGVFFGGTSSGSVSSGTYDPANPITIQGAFGNISFGGTITPTASDALNTNETAPPPALAGADLGPITTGPGFGAFTPDALMAYCQTRLGSIDQQAEESFDTQNENAQEANDIGTVANDFKNYEGSDTTGAQSVSALENELGGLIQDLQKGDPNSAALPKLTDALKTLTQDAMSGSNTVTSSQMGSIAQQISDAGTDLNSSSELQMIQLQSLMSQRSEAITLASNLVQSLGDEQDKVADNIGK
jgi:hypothetical protein